MARYVDGFVVTLPKKNLDKYKKMAKCANKYWIKYGALEVLECLGDEMNEAKKWGGLTFPELTNKKPNEVVLYSFIIYRSKAHRKRVNAKVMADPDMQKECSGENMPFEIKKMAFGGFESFVHYKNY